MPAVQLVLPFPPAGARGRGVGSCAGTLPQREFLERLYAHLNRTRFEGRLPPVPLRLSSRMKRCFGHVLYYRTARGERQVIEIALNVELMRDDHARLLLDTLLHEMAHVEAWIRYGHRRHGATWKRIARRVGCEPRACTHAPLQRRTRGAPRAAGVPAGAMALLSA